MEASTFHTRLTKAGLAVEECRAYWERRRTQPAPNAQTAFSEYWFGAKSLLWLQRLMADMRERFEAFPESLQVLASWNRMPASVRTTICHWHLQLADPLYRAFTGLYLPRRHRDGFESTSGEIVSQAIEEVCPDRWQVATRKQFARKLLYAVISLPGGVFKPYAGVSTAILVFTKTNSGGTDHVWFYDVEADGWSLDDKRTPLLPEEKLGVVPAVALTAEEHAKNNLPDILARWQKREKSERKNRPRTAQSFCVPKADIAAQGYDLSLNRYKEVIHEEVTHRKPGDILKALDVLEAEIQQGMKQLKGMLK